MHCELTNASALFRHDDQVAGEYVLNDPFKPHFSRLLTPRGHNTVLVSPGDHPHHKGLMYALRCADLNFWEERPERGQCGVQTILSTEVIEGGLRQKLLWHALGGGIETYREVRTITCRTRDDGTAFVWNWRTQREALRDHELIMSEWSSMLPDGRSINYHGLGIRLPWMWRFPGAWAGAVEVDGQPTDPLEACGSCGPSLGFWGLIDGQPQATRAAVTIRQAHGFTWFVLKDDFPYLAVGPTNASGLVVCKGDMFDETYQVVVEDRR